MKSKWRAVANQTIAEVVKNNPGIPEVDLRRKIRDAYPFGERGYHPYKIWLSAVNMHFNPRQRTLHKPAPMKISENQISMLEEF